MTREQWDVHWYRVRNGHTADGALPTEADALADVDTAEQFGPRPEEES